MRLPPWLRGYFGWISGWIGNVGNAGFVQPWANSISISTAMKVPFPSTATVVDQKQPSRKRIRKRGVETQMKSDQLALPLRRDGDRGQVFAMSQMPFPRLGLKARSLGNLKAKHGEGAPPRL